jgi:hypothetical protein
MDLNYFNVIVFTADRGERECTIVIEHRASSRAGTNWNSPTGPRSEVLAVRSHICQATASNLLGTSQRGLRGH